MKCLIAGAGGFIGGHLMKRLQLDGHEIICADIKPISSWFQISDKKNGTNERILIDASFIPNDLKILDFLGSGQKNIGFSNPNTKIHQLPFYQLIKIGLICFLIAPLSLFVLLGKKIDKFAAKIFLDDFIRENTLLDEKKN